MDDRKRHSQQYLPGGIEGSTYRTVRRVHEAATALKRSEAMAWLDILTDGNPLQDPEKSIHKLVSELEMEETEFRAKIAIAIKEETQKLRRSYDGELKEEFRLDISTEVDAKVKQVVAEVKREADARDKRVKREVA